MQILATSVTGPGDAGPPALNGAVIYERDTGKYRTHRDGEWSEISEEEARKICERPAQP